MKKSLLIIVFILSSSLAKSQILISLLLGDKLNSDKFEYGLDGGLNFSTLKGVDNKDYRTSFNLGFYFDIATKNPKLLFNTGLMMKSNMGAKGLQVYSVGNPNLDAALAGGTVTRQLSYFSVPLMLKYRVGNSIYIKGGVHLGLRYKAYDEFFKTYDGGSELTYKLNIKKQYHPFDAGLAIGLGYRFLDGRGMSLGVKYYFGLVDIRIDDSTPNQYNRVLYVTAGIPIGKSQKEEK